MFELGWYINITEQSIDDLPNNNINYTMIKNLWRMAGLDTNSLLIAKYSDNVVNVDLPISDFILIVFKRDIDSKTTAKCNSNTNKKSNALHFEFEAIPNLPNMIVHLRYWFPEIYHTVMYV